MALTKAEQQAKAALWVVVELIAEYEGRALWDLVGVFSSEEEALMLCKDRGPNLGLGPVVLGKPFPAKRCTWVGFYYPGEFKQ